MSDLLKSISLAALLALGGPAFAQDEAGGEADGQPAAEQPDAETDAAAPQAPADQEAPADAAAEDEAGSSDRLDVANPTGADTLNMGEPAEGDEGPGTSYTAESFGDWQQRCVRTADGSDPCQLYQLLRDDNGNAVAEMSIFPLPAGRQAAAGSTIITPLETLLTRDVRLSVDGGQVRRYPFDFCAQQGCIARVGFTQGEVDQFRRGAAGTLTIVPAAAPDQTIDLTISLNGFTAGYDAVTKVNAPE